MKVVVALAAVFGSASAFAPTFMASQGRVSTRLNAEKSKSLPWMNRPPLLDGSLAGDVGFDPLGLSNIDDVGIDLYWLTEAEIKHCRLAMLAVAGFLWVEIFGPAPGCEAASDKSQVDAFWQLWNTHPQYIGAGLVLVGLIEAITGIAITTGRENGIRNPGEFGFDPAGFSRGDPAKYEDLKLSEIKNGRLAMWAAAGLLLQSWTTHEGGIENLLQAIKDNSF